MRLTDAPLHQEQWRVLVEAPFGMRSASRISDKLEFIGFQLHGAQRRYRIRMNTQDALDLHSWLTEQLQKDGLLS